MKEFVLSVSKGIKRLFREKVNVVILLLILILGFGIYAYVKIVNRIDYRYYSHNRTIEMIHGVEIGARGVLKGKLTEKQKQQKEQYEQDLNDFRHHKRRL